MRIGMGGQLRGDIGLQGLDLSGQGGQRGHQGASYRRPGRAVSSGRPVGGGLQPGVQLPGPESFPPAGQRAQPRRQVFLAQLASRVLRLEAGQERQADLAIQVRQLPGGTGERHGEVGAQLVARRDPVRSRSRRARTAAGNAVVAGVSTASGRSRARSVRSASASTNASHRSSLASADPYRERRFFICREVVTTTVSPASSSAPSLRSIAASLTPAARSPAISLPMPARGCSTANGGARLGLTRPRPGHGDGEPGTDLAGGIHDADGMIGAAPVDSGGQPARRCFRQNPNLGILHHSLLAAYPVGRHPYSRSRDACRQLTVRRLKARRPCGRSGASRAAAGPAELALDLAEGPTR